MSDLFFPQPLLKPFELHLRKVAAQNIVLERVEDLPIEVEERRAYGRTEVRYRLVTAMLEEQLVKKTHTAEVTATAFAEVIATATATCPATWWQHLKQDHFPHWFIRRWPVRTEEVVESRGASATKSNTETVSITFEQYAQFPAAAIQTPEKIRGPIVVVREDLKSTNWPEELT